jgi:hypothetical protein
VTYQTKIVIEIAGVRRSLQFAVDYHVETVEGEILPIQDHVCVLERGRLVPGEWVYHAMGPRQLKELEARLMKQWGRTTAAQQTAAVRQN